MDVLPGGDDPDFPVGQARLYGHPHFECPSEAILPNYDDGVFGLGAPFEGLPALQFERVTDLVVDESVVPAEAVLDQLVELRLQAFIIAVGFAESGRAALSGDLRINLA